MTLLIIIVLVLFITSRIRASNRKHKEEIERREWEKEQKRREEEQRRSTPCPFLDGLSRSDFESIVFNNANRIQRVKRVSINGAQVEGRAYSRSGISEWNFNIDFNDYGHITGRYWLKSDNSDSNIPEGLAESISDDIKWYYKHPPIRNV